MNRGACAIALALLGAAVLTPRASSQRLEPDPASQPPPPPTSFLAPDTDPAGRIARQIADLVPRMPNLRAWARLGQWRLDERARWSIRAEQACLGDLSELGVDAVPFTTDRTPIPTPVRLRGPIGGVRYVMLTGNDPIVSCELATRLVHFSEVLRRHGIDRVVISSSWREQPETSFHRMGLAIDIRSFHGPGVEHVVARHYPSARTQPTCPAPANTRPLQRIACDVAETGRFSTMITPAYSPGHWNHFHLDARPDDPRVFVR